MPEKQIDLWSRVEFRERDNVCAEWYRNNRLAPDVLDQPDVYFRALVAKYGEDNLKRFDHEVWRRHPKGVLLPWYFRENERMATRQQPVWIKERFWEQFSDRHRMHFVHVSETDPRLLAYTQDNDKGNRDIQTPLKPGRYLSLHFNNVLSEKKIKWLASWQASGRRPDDEVTSVEIKFASTPEAIVDVYLRGPHSCMDGRTFEKAATHPCQVYGAGDLAVAYTEGEKFARVLGPDGAYHENKKQVTARCLVWPEKKIAGRVYPTPERWSEDGYASWHQAVDSQDGLMFALRRQGYTFTGEDQGISLNGAKLLKIPFRGGWMMPYIDGVCGVKDAGDYLEMADSKSGSEFSCQNTCGFINSACIDVCDRCDEAIYSGDNFWAIGVEWRDNSIYRYEDWCLDCKDDHAFLCEGIGEWCSYDLECVAVGPDLKVCRGFVDHNCFWSDWSHMHWFIDERDQVDMDDGSVWTDSEFEEHGFTCAVTDRKLPVDRRHPEHYNIADDLTAEQIAAYVCQGAEEKPVKKKASKPAEPKGRPAVENLTSAVVCPDGVFDQVPPEVLDRTRYYLLSLENLEDMVAEAPARITRDTAYEIRNTQRLTPTGRTRR